SARLMNPMAYEFYLKGQHYFWRREVESAVESFNRAIELDPQYAEAYAGLAKSYVLFEMQDTPLTPRESIARAKAAASRALQIDDKLAEPHVALGWAKLSYDWDWAGAEEEFKLAEELNPSYELAPLWDGCELVWEGKFELSFAEMRRARELAPASGFIHTFF